MPGPQSLALTRRLRNSECGEITFVGDGFPIFWKQARGCLVTDVDGNTYLDATSSFGVLGVGHSHPAVRRAITRQAGLLVHGMGDVHPSETKVLLLEAIARHVPIPDARIILGQNGSDAVEAALKTALLATGRAGVLAFEGGYHGLSYGALETTARAFFREPFAAQRGRFAAHLPFGCAHEQIESTLRDGRFGAVIVEPIQGRGGIRVPPAGWLAAAAASCRRAGALLIVDEIFTGWGRTGCWFACEEEGIVPDILCVGKAMGGGMPISACVASRALMEAAWGANGSSGEARHTYTFLGHPVACAAALAAIEAIEKQRLVARSRRSGEILLKGLEGLARRFPEKVVEARGRGLMTGFALADGALANLVMRRALGRGLIVLPAGDAGDVIEVVPPFTISRGQIAWLLETLGDVLADV